MDRHRYDWSELYPELLSLIAGTLKTRQDLHNFRSVCKNWRFSSSSSSSFQTLETLPLLHPQLPFKFPPNSIPSLNGFISDHFFFWISRGSPFHLVANAVYLLRPRSHPNSSQSWIVTVEESNPGKFHLRFPLTKNIVNGSSYNFPKSLNLSCFNVSMLCCGYNLRTLGCQILRKDSIFNRTKVVCFSNPNFDAPLTIILLISQVSLAWARLGSDWDQRGHVRCGNVSKFDDIVDYKGCVYAIDKFGRVFVIHNSLIPPKRGRSCPNLRVECVAHNLVFSGCDTDRRKRLVLDTFGVLYIVHRDVYCGEKVDFKVYRLDEERGKWDQVSSLGERRVLFVGVDCCFFASVDDFRGCRGNCIIFHKHSFPKYDYGVSSNDSFFQGTSNELSFGVFHLEDGDAGLISAYPGVSALLWPPPVWLSPNSSSPAR